MYFKNHQMHFSTKKKQMKIGHRPSILRSVYEIVSTKYLKEPKQK